MGIAPPIPSSTPAYGVHWSSPASKHAHEPRTPKPTQQPDEALLARPRTKTDSPQDRS